MTRPRPGGTTLAAYLRARELLPEAIEHETQRRLEPAIWLFAGGEYQGVNRNVSKFLPRFKPWYEWLLCLAPERHRIEHWLERIETGVCPALAFIRDDRLAGVGFVNIETDDAGQLTACAYIATEEPLDLRGLAVAIEAAALQLRADGVELWTPNAVPVVPGYSVKSCWTGFLQITAIKPRQ